MKALITVFNKKQSIQIKIKINNTYYYCYLIL